MSRPQIIVNVDTALTRRGDASDTGTAFMAFAGATGPTDPVEVYNEKQAVDAGVPTSIAAFIGDALAEGCPKVVVVRATAADAGAVTEAEWDDGLAKFGSGYGAGQLLIPGISTAAAHAALINAAGEQGRVALLDGASNATSATPLIVIAAPKIICGVIASRRITPASVKEIAGVMSR